MSTYNAPLGDMLFSLQELAGLDEISRLPGYEESSPDIVRAVLEEAATFARNVLAPLNVSGDRAGVTHSAQGVQSAAGFAKAYRQFVDAGWNTLSCSPEFGGQGLPQVLLAATTEMWNAANMAFALCPLLTSGAVETLHAHGSPELKAIYLHRMVSGEWTGTMNLTEPQAGSDLSAIRCRAVRNEGHYRIFGQKTFITWGEHDMADNIVHLVLARLPEAPEGVKGISLFLVPKILPEATGKPGRRNDLSCISVEHKLGIHASPTCTMSYGDREGAIGFLIGEENKGLAHMFTMMNEARQKVGVQGVSLAEMAYQRALAYARERLQGYPPERKSGERVAIIEHPDVRRMLLSMKSQTSAMRALSFVLAGEMDRLRGSRNISAIHRHQKRIELLTPIFKGWATELSLEIASTGIQIHGGTGFIEETGAAQFLRDARILSIYEGTTGIQAADLVGRKLVPDQGTAMSALITEMRETEQGLMALKQLEHTASLQSIGEGLHAAIDALTSATARMLEIHAASPKSSLTVAVDYLMLAGYVCGGWLMAKSALAAAGRATEQVPETSRWIGEAAFYTIHILPKAQALHASITGGRQLAAVIDDYPFDARH